MEKYGFIYLWYDRKRKMFYIGSHWGNVDDGYICSSNRMRDAYRRRPNDFKRRVIQNNVLRETLLDEEHRWLSLIDENELGKKYYNLRKHKWGHWSTDIDKSKTIKEKLSIARRKRIITKETKRRTSITLKGKKKAKFSEQHKLNLSIAAKGKTKAKWTEERKKAAGMRQIGRKLSKETKEKISNTLKNKCQS